MCQFSGAAGTPQKGSGAGTEIGRRLGSRPGDPSCLIFDDNDDGDSADDENTADSNEDNDMNDDDNYDYNVNDHKDN